MKRNGTTSQITIKAAIRALNVLFATHAHRQAGSLSLSLSLTHTHTHTHSRPTIALRL